MGPLLLILLPVLLYVLLIRPQQKKIKDQQALAKAVEEGDEVMTTAGIYGIVTALEGEDAWLEIAEGVEIHVARGAIARRVPPTVSVDAAASTDEDDDVVDPVEPSDATTDDGKALGQN